MLHSFISITLVIQLTEFISCCVQLHLFLCSCSFILLLPFSVRYVLTEPFIHLSDSSRHGPRKNFKYSHYSAGWVIEHSLCFICQSHFWKSSLFQKVRHESSCSRWSFILRASNWCNKKDLGGVNAITQKCHISSALLTNVHLLLKVISLNCHEWGTKANFPLRKNDSMCFIKWSVNPEIKIIDNILSSCEIHKILLKGILSHPCVYLCHLEKVFPSFRFYYAGLLCNWASCLPSPFFKRSIFCGTFGQPCTLRVARITCAFFKDIRIIYYIYD